jgi:aminoglycoside/choline kinase family phosphotransferase
MIHGDYHPNNVMIQDDEIVLIDMGDVSYGHPIFDFLATAATQVNLVKLSPEYAETHTKMPAELITRTWNRLIAGYFPEFDSEKRQKIEEQIAMFSKLKVALAPHFGRGADPAIIKASIDDAKANFLPVIDELIGKVDW